MCALYEEKYQKFIKFVGLMFVVCQLRVNHISYQRIAVTNQS